MKKIIFSILFAAISSSARAANIYVGPSATGNGTGSDWSNTTTLSAVRPSAGDVVYLSGGAHGATQTYSVSNWTPAGGTTSAPITYKIGQDSSHNGTVLFSGSGSWLGGGISNVIISGDAGDGARHFSLAASESSQSSYGTVINTLNSTHLRISYLNCGLMDGGNLSPFYFGVGSNNAIELDHIYIYVTGGPTQAGFSALWNGNAAGYDQSKAHDNVIYVPNDGNGVGPDGFKWQQNGVSVYNNTVIGYFKAGASGDHQDGDQIQGGDYTKVYNNRFVDLANYAVFYEGAFGGFNHVRIYNNIAIITSPAIRSSSPPGGLVVGAKNASTFNDVLIANNAVVDYGGHGGIAFNNVNPVVATFTNSLVANNIILNSGAITLAGNTTTPSNNNATLTSATAGTYFNNYSLGNANDNLHLLAAASSLIGQGANLTSWGVTTDMDGNPRPATGNWDVGPYIYCPNGGCPTPTPTPSPSGTPAPTPTPTPSPATNHPGDADQNMHMTLNEATQYGFCWKSAPTIPTGCPVGANLNNATRAGLLYGSTLNGAYHFDSTQAIPACWVPGP